MHGRTKIVDTRYYNKKENEDNQEPEHKQKINRVLIQIDIHFLRLTF